MTVINTNVKALYTQAALKSSERASQSAMQQLSTGKRINSAADDAAGLAISSRMTSQIRGLDQAVRNANDGISLLQTAEGALIEVTNMMQRMRELAVQASNGTVTSTDQSSLNLEFVQLRTEIERVANQTQWNGENVLSGTAGTSSNGTAVFQVGGNSLQTMSVAFGDWNLNASTTDVAGVPAVYDFTIDDAGVAALAGDFPALKEPQWQALVPGLSALGDN